MSSNLHGIALRLTSVLLLTAMSAAVHGVADRVPVGQIMFWRSALALIPICAYAAWLGPFPDALKTCYPGLHIKRSLFGAFSMAMAFLSLAYLPVANAQALAYLSPILSLPLAALLLGERLTTPILLAVALGFGGSVVLLWQALEMPGEGALIGVCAGLAYAFTMAYVRVHIKAMTQTETASAIAFYFAVVSALVGLATLPFGWVSLDTEAYIWLVFAGLVGGLAHILSSEAVARAPVAVLAPFDFTGLVWALGFDLVLFGVVPGALSWIGVVLITGAALLVTFATSPKGAAPRGR